MKVLAMFGYVWLLERPGARADKGSWMVVVKRESLAGGPGHGSCMASPLLQATLITCLLLFPPNCWIGWGMTGLLFLVSDLLRRLALWRDVRVLDRTRVC